MKSTDLNSQAMVRNTMMLLRRRRQWHCYCRLVLLGLRVRRLAYALLGESEGDDDLYLMINMHWEDADFHHPGGRAGRVAAGGGYG